MVEQYYINGASNYCSDPLSDEMLAEKEIVDKKCKEYKLKHIFDAFADFSRNVRVVHRVKVNAVNAA